MLILSDININLIKPDFLWNKYKSHKNLCHMFKLVTFSPFYTSVNCPSNLIQHIYIYNIHIKISTFNEQNVHQNKIKQNGK